MLYKAFPVAFKALDQVQGIFEALVAVFGNVDRTGDRVMKGAFAKSLDAWQEKGRPIPVVFAHEWDNLDAHIGHVLEAKETDAGLYIKGQLEMDEDFASRVWKKLNLGTLADFSFSYDVVSSELVDEGRDSRPRYVNNLNELELFEVGPCLVGMNPATRLLGVKSALATHSTPTTDAAWDGPANEARLKSDGDEAYYRRAYAWRNPDGDPAVKSSYKFIHHMVSADGTPGAANIRACQTSIGVLNGGRGGTTIPGEDRQGVYNHVARHLRDADLEAPELRALSASSYKTGARHTTKEYEQIQQIHDLAIALGAKCAEGDNTEQTSSDRDEDASKDEIPSGAKSSKGQSSILAVRIATDMIENGFDYKEHHESE